ncbi:MAG: hypothetical protein IJ699_04185 [Bacteroidaceae bacterium]|nr:hypothetical protein [Bacteroidaceae bacterium]
MNHCVCRCVAATLFAVALAACHSSKTARQAAPAAPAPAPVVQSRLTSLSASDRARLDYIYQEATRQKLVENHSGAFDLLCHAYDICPDAPEVLYDLALYRLALRQDSLAERLFVRAAALDPQNTYYKEALASFYLQRRRTEEALPQLETLATLQPKRTDVLSQLVTIYSNLDRPADAIRTLDRIELLDGKMASVSYRKFALYKSMEKEQEAFAELESLCEEYPHEMSYRLAIGDQLLTAGRIDEAEKVYDEVRRTEPDNLGLKLSMLELYRQTEQDSLFRATRDSLLYAPKTESDTRAALLRDLISSEMKDDSIGRQRVEQAFARLDEAFPQDLALLQLRAAYLATYDKSNDSAFVAVMDRVNELEPANTQALFYLIQYYAEHQDFEHLENICRRAVLTHPEELLCHYFLGVALYQQDKKREALAAFRAGIVQKNEDSRPAMVADLYSVMGDILHEMGSEREAYAAYDSCLVYQDDNVQCLNNYAYYLSLQETDLDRAEEMSYRTIRLQPNNKTYLDTYAWILFMKQRYSEAQIYIDRVCPPDSADAELLADPEISGVVFEHAGDIAACNGNLDQALRFWQLAQQAGGNGLTALLPRKIKLKKYIAK